MGHRHAAGVLDRRPFVDRCHNIFAKADDRKYLSGVNHILGLLRHIEAFRQRQWLEVGEPRDPLFHVLR